MTNRAFSWLRFIVIEEFATELVAGYACPQFRPRFSLGLLSEPHRKVYGDEARRINRTLE